MSKHKNDQHKTSWMQLLPIIIAIAFIPLLVHTFEYKTGLSVFDWFPNNSESSTDMFMALKAIAIILTAILSGVLLIYRRSKERNPLRFDNSFYLLLFYLLFVVMSALFSPYKKWVVFGTYELLEPVWVLLAYGLLCYYTYNTVRDEEQLSKIFKISGIGILIAILIGISQALGNDFFNSLIGKKLILSSSYWNDLESVKFYYENSVYMTLYNPNYVIFYIGIILPVLIALFINQKKLWHRVAIAALTLGAVTCLIGSKTTTGWMAILLALIICGLILFSRNKKAFIAASSLLVVVCVTGGIILMTNPSCQAIKDTIVGTYKADRDFGIKSIKTGQDICIDYNGLNTHFTYGENPSNQTLLIEAVDDNGKGLNQVMTDEGAYSFVDDNSVQFLVSPSMINDKVGLCITVDEHQWFFLRQDDGTYLYYNAAAKCVEFPQMKHVQWFNDDAVSGRGHIWNKTIPVLAKHLFIGSGANTYMFEVPQEDYLYKTYLDINNNFDVKAHNWFLQQWVENGLLATICLLGFYLWYVVSSVRLFRKISFKENLHRISFALFTGLLIYVIAALANDPTVNVATLFWCGIGLGFSVNKMIIDNCRKSQKEIL